MKKPGNKTAGFQLPARNSWGAVLRHRDAHAQPPKRSEFLSSFRPFLFFLSLVLLYILHIIFAMQVDIHFSSFSSIL